MIKTFGRAALFAALSFPTYGGTVTFLNSPASPIDTVNWSAIGGDGATIQNATTVSSAAGDKTTISLGTQPVLGGVISVACAAVNPANCSWGAQTSGFSTGDRLMWLEGLDNNGNPVGTGPLTLTLQNQVAGLGLYLQSVSSGAFSASLALYNGASLLGSKSYGSDLAGDPLFVGARDTLSEINKAVLTVTSCGSFACDPNDFSVDTLQIFAASAAVPEPSTFLLAGSLLALALALQQRPRKEKMK